MCGVCGVLGVPGFSTLCGRSGIAGLFPVDCLLCICMGEPPTMGLRGIGELGG